MFQQRDSDGVFAARVRIRIPGHVGTGLVSIGKYKVLGCNSCMHGALTAVARRRPINAKEVMSSADGALGLFSASVGVFQNRGGAGEAS